MTRLAQSLPFQTATVGRSTRPSLITRLRERFARTGAAMEAQARLTAIDKEILRDTRLSPEDLTGESSYDPELPFFLQSGFGRSDR